MRTVYEYLDYREFLKDAFETRKRTSPPYPYRTLGKELGLETSNVFRVLQGRAHLPARCLSRAMKFLELSGHSAEYFLILITSSRERDPKTRKEILEKAKTLRASARRESKTSANRRSAGVRTKSGSADGGTATSDLEAPLPPNAGEDDGMRTFDLLLKLGTVARRESQAPVFHRIRANGADQSPAAVGCANSQILTIVSESIDRFPDLRKDVSVLTFAADFEAMIEIRGILRRCEEQVRRRIQATEKPDRILHLAMGLVPQPAASDAGSGAVKRTARRNRSGFRLDNAATSAILDRFLDQAEIIPIEGKSYRTGRKRKADIDGGQLSPRSPG